MTELTKNELIEKLDLEQRRFIWLENSPTQAYTISISVACCHDCGNFLTPKDYIFKSENGCEYCRECEQAIEQESERMSTMKTHAVDKNGVAVCHINLCKRSNMKINGTRIKSEVTCESCKKSSWLDKTLSKVESKPKIEYQPEYYI